MDASLWQAAVEQIGEQPSWRWVQDLTYEGSSGNEIQLRLAEGHADRAGFVRGRGETLAAQLSRLSGRTVRVRIDLPAARGPSRPRHGATQQELDEAMQMPLTRQAANLFNATPIDVRAEPEAGPEPTGE